MSMEYFKKIQCYKPGMGIIDAPINIEEVALLQDSVDKNMLGRIKFVNYSKQSIIAIFVRLRAANIAGESISLDKERFIYQDMKISSGELYGNRIPISLPEDTRYFSVQLEKVVFDNGEIWDATNGAVCKISQKQIQVPEEVLDSVREELQKHLNNVEYVHYFYEEEQNFWGCTCGKINSDATRVCTFCGNSQNSQKYYLTEENVNRLVIEKQKEIEYEKQKKLLIEAEKKRIEEEKIRKIQQERLEKWEQLRKEQEENEKKKEAVKKKKKKIHTCILCIIVIALIVLAVLGYKSMIKNRAKSYQTAMSAYENEDYKLAAEKFDLASTYKDSAEKWKESLEMQIEEDKDELDAYFKDTWNAGDVISLIDVLCYMDKPRKYINKYSDFKLDNSLGSGKYLCKYGTYDYEYVILDFGYYNDNLSGITFLGNSKFLDQDEVNRLLKKEYDESSYGCYTWNVDNDIFKKVVLDDSYSLEIGDERVSFDYELTFWQ